MQFKQEVIDLLGSQKDHFWFFHRNKIIYRILKQTLPKISAKDTRVIEIGCGGCQIANYLSCKEYIVTASDIHEVSKKYLNPNIDFFLHNLDIHSPSKKYLNQFDCVILGDVIEHIKKPEIALLNALQFLEKNGILIVTVPALKLLWSDYDCISGHFTRYNKKLGIKVLENAGCKVLKTEYFMVLPAIILYFQRKIFFSVTNLNKEYKNCLEIDPKINFLMKIWMSIEYTLAKFLKFPFGSSLILVGKKIASRNNEKNFK